jgi:hypothetical protein
MMNKLRKNLDEAKKLNCHFLALEYEGNQDLDVICTYLASCLMIKELDEDILDRIPRLVRQIKEKLSIFPLRE